MRTLRRENSNENRDSSNSPSQLENGSSDSFSMPNTEEAVNNELLQQMTLDDHLIEFSEAMRTVAKALTRATEAKAAAQAEASEWKHKYELERACNLKLEGKEKPAESLQDHGICSHEVYGDGESDSGSNIAYNRITIKASFKLSWCFKGVDDEPQKNDFVSFGSGNITTGVRSSKQIYLKWESSPLTVLIFTKPNSVSVRIICAQMVRWLKEERKMNIYVEPRVRNELLTESPFFSFVQTWEDDMEVSLLHTKVDFVVTLGGDGTVLWAASKFKGPVPPVVAFSLGSLGFMTPFHSQNYKDCFDSILRSPIRITLRHRLQCHIIRATARSETETEETILVLNEGDGIILSTTSGATAYSLAAGGSMVHPQVPGILFTPISPHSLSFRPLILPEHVTIRVLVPSNSKSPAWASFDGKNRRQLSPGDALICSQAPWPVPTACQGDSTEDFFRSIHGGLLWNLRKNQSFDGSQG
ncbi:hypothetical protein ACFE04_026941 [Oxalis oulophora]